MKLKFTLCLFLAAVCFSCSFVPRIEKRHYGNGYYIEHSQQKLQTPSFEIISAAVPAVVKAKDQTATLLPEIPEDTVAVRANAAKKIIHPQKKNTFVKAKSAPVISPQPIDVPKEPFNKKAKVAVVFFVLAKITLLAAFIVSLFSLLTTVFIVAGIAVLFALVAIIFGLSARKELAAQLPYEKELGEKEANEVVGRAIGGIASAVFIVAVAFVIEWLKKQF